MADNSKIEWTGHTLNIVTGCTKISDGCLNCYIERTMPFRTTRRRFDKPGIGGATDVQLHPERLLWPLTKWRKPSLIFVNSLADLFHESVPDSFLDEAFGAMAVAHALHGHTFQVLTKRHARMRSYLTNAVRSLPGGYIGSTRSAIAGAAHRWAIDRVNAGALSDGIDTGHQCPLPGVWLGVSVENQRWADVRIPALLETPAALRWISAEPLLGPVELKASHCPAHDFPGGFCKFSCPQRNKLAWVVLGGESGPGARPMELAWAESLVEQCQAARVPAFVKQLGSRWGKAHHDINLFPESLQVREFPVSVSQRTEVQ